MAGPASSDTARCAQTRAGAVALIDSPAIRLISVDFFLVPTIRFQILYVFLVLAHDRRRILHFGVTAHPTADFSAGWIFR